jgi:hypothetical protein
MSRKPETPVLVILLLGLSLVIYLIQFLLFRRISETEFYFLQDLAFVPISVLLVTLGLNTVLVYRQRQQTLEKVSIVINEFFAEAGTDLIARLRGFIINLETIKLHLQPDIRWQNQDFAAATAFLASTPVEVDAARSDLTGLAVLLDQKKGQILRLFENPSLLEHDRFTDMLWAVYHVHDELRNRPSLEGLPASDLRHLSGDLQRAGQLLLTEWVESMRQLKSHYPYLYSLAVRKSPFGPGQVTVSES